MEIGDYVSLRQPVSSRHSKNGASRHRGTSEDYCYREMGATTLGSLQNLQRTILVVLVRRVASRPVSETRRKRHEVHVENSRSDV